MTVIIEYFEALERLKNGKPERVLPGIRITNDSVALEAGRKKGSIKKSRDAFLLLIDAINEAALRQGKSKKIEKEKTEKAKIKADNYRMLYEKSLGREVMLIKKVYQLEAKLAKLSLDKVAELHL